MAKYYTGGGIEGYEGFETLRGLQPLTRAFDLATARLRDSDILVDAPFAAHNYGSPLRAYRRIKYISGLVEENEMRASVLLHDERAVGVGSAVPADFPGTFDELRDAGIRPELPMTAVEIDYWHADLAPAQRSVFDARTTRTLISQSLGLVGARGGDMVLAWQAVPTVNVSEQEACLANGMVPVGEPGNIAIGDGVDLVRQVYAKPAAILG
ncbi:MAG: hypothetical protein KIH63_000705 [Candidatus Saccharibacteria bacterium]|nr:hypothetical protein [Candidatus Saccharibacteria bacterium]